MAYVRRITDVEIDMADVAFDSDEAKDMIISNLEGMDDGDLSQVMVEAYTNASDALRMAKDIANEMRGGFDNDEQLELLEELDFAAEGTSELTPEQMEDLVVRNWKRFDYHGQQRVLMAMGDITDVLKLVLDRWPTTDMMTKKGKHLAISLAILAVRRAFNDFNSTQDYLREEKK